MTQLLGGAGTWDGCYHLTPNLSTTDQRRHWFAMASHTETFIIKLLLRGGSMCKQLLNPTENGICRYAQIDAWILIKSGGSHD